ncbi:MAG: guanylate kinase [Proteocatella sp.]
MINIIIFVGPSASGKSTIRDKFGFQKIITYTTRSPRIYEFEGVDYYFTNKERIFEMYRAGELLEYNRYGNDYYASSLKTFEDVVKNNELVSVVLDKNGAEKVKAYFGNKAVVIGIFSPLEECIERINLREDLDSEMRIKSFEEELRCTHEISDLIINNSKKHWNESMKIISIIKNGILNQNRL